MSRRPTEPELGVTWYGLAGTVVDVGVVVAVEEVVVTTGADVLDAAAVVVVGAVGVTATRAVRALSP